MWSSRPSRAIDEDDRAMNRWARIAAVVAGCLAMATSAFNADEAQDPLHTRTFSMLPADLPVTVTEDASTYTLANGRVVAKVNKRTGDLISLVYNGIETIDSRSGRPSGYWSHDASGGTGHAASVTIDPQSNGGARGEVSIKGIAGGRPMGSGPGGSTVADIEIRYTMNFGEPGLYTYCIFDHPPNYPATSVGEARFCAKLNDDVFDWMTVDARRNMKVITAYDWNHGTVMNMKEARRMNSGMYKGQVEHKYDYSANQFETLAWGWSSTEKHIGIWFVNPTIEYLSGGPTKVELSAHRDATFGNDPNAPAPPCLLNYWRGSHYGGSSCVIAQGEAWTKVIGPFLIYCNSAHSQQAMWQDALARAAKEAAKWPYDWVSGVDYPHKDERGTVSGQIVLSDPMAPNAPLTNLLVGLTHPDYTPQGERGSGRGGAPTDTQVVDWQHDAKHYEFWVRGDAKGHFAIPKVHPGTYTLHAIADGVLGEYAKSDIIVRRGQTMDLGKLDWRPVRFGRQLWDIGIPNRTGSEFFKGDDYFHWGMYIEYAKLFPNDVNYVIGKSDYRKDWYFEQVPHDADPDDTTGTGTGRSTTWSVFFDLPSAPHGKAVLRLAICGVGARSIAVTVNDKTAGQITGLVYNATINRDGIGGSWVERDLAFDAALLKIGANVLKLTIPAGDLTGGIIYDYLRLELDESASFR
jgi:rhamnogalacturonan endolyase